MTEELETMITNAHKEEMEGFHNYAKMSEMAKNEGMHCTAGILDDIAHDEKSHVDALQHILRMGE